MDPRPGEAHKDSETTTSFPLTVDEADALAVPISRDAALGPNTDGPPLDVVEQQGLTIDGAKPIIPRDRVPFPTRPILKRDKSTPLSAPQQPPPPAPTAPPADDAGATDSLSLGQLKLLVRDMPQTQEQTSYAFTYDDASSFAAELEEWFSYTVEERAMILKTHTSFVQQWIVFQESGQMLTEPDKEQGSQWTTVEQTQRSAFIEHCLSSIRERENVSDRLEVLEALTYVAHGNWHETAGLHQDIAADVVTEVQDVGDLDGTREDLDSSVARSGPQVEWIKKNLRSIIEADGIPLVFRLAHDACYRACNSAPNADFHGQTQELEKRELWCALTLMYFCLEFARLPTLESPNRNTRSRLLRLEPDFLVTFMDLISRTRWDENVPLPMTKLLLLIWKGILVFFGGLPDVQAAKDCFRDPSLGREDQHGNPLITASPLDYHLFRQEISSKYPAYSAPPPLFPLEPENNSILPPIKNHPSKTAGSNVFGSGVDFNNNGTSIFHQPVHIATPAPSPPPSPAGPGGKGGKKQNYQTNQMFPFLYPPLDETANSLGGKGSTDLQDLLVGRKWEGSDIPASILEAAELFSTRMRASRSMKQLWDVRVQFMKYERGWSNSIENQDIEALELSDADKNRETQRRATPPAGSVDERLELVEAFYKDALPHLQSLIIVLIRVILNHVTALVTQANGVGGGLQSGFQYQENGTSAVKNEASFASNAALGESSASAEEIDTNRNQEITDKALTGILVLLLKWFKLSHILKFEYLTQLLVDSSYIPLVLKLLQLQEIEKLVSFTSDQQDANFFNFCISHSRNTQSHETSEPQAPITESSSEDEAAPPPIKRTRSPNIAADTAAPTDQLNSLASTTGPAHPLPEVDELGAPASDSQPLGPITTFSWRVFFTTINYLRILQKSCKSKAHRNLMLVSFKSSQVLRKCLRVPHPMLRLYTLKLFKNQVPYCGRKWRQTNMKVITAVYLDVRPELRDEWLSGSDVDNEVDESVPLEQALRALTHWWNLRCYPEAMGAERGILDEERDFFRRELEKMSWIVGDASADGELEGARELGGNWEGGAVDGW